MHRRERLSSPEVQDVLRLSAVCAVADGAAPLSEHVRLAIRYGTDADVAHLLITAADGSLAGYAYVERSAPGVAELCVHPAQRGRGYGARLVAEIAGAAPVQVWAHGDHPSASALAQRFGLSDVRHLFRLRRRLDTIDGPKVPDGVRIRAFRPGADEEAWLAVNARAFAEHPEQGGMTIRDLRLRMAEDWFDPAGLLLAERDGAIVGFHWTKVHGGDRPLGEVYVLGVDPDAQGLGLGRVLTDAGLAHLKGRGLDTVMLYVDESNAGAVGLYRRSGFARWSTDVMYRA